MNDRKLPFSTFVVKIANWMKTLIKPLLVVGINITFLLRRNKMNESQNIFNEKRTDLFIKYDEIM